MAVHDLSSDPASPDDQSRAELFQRIRDADFAESPPSPMDTSKWFAFLGPFTFPVDADIDRTTNVDRTNVVFGADISHWTADEIPLEAFVQNRIKFCYTKATQGTSYRDPKFKQFWDRMAAMPNGRKLHRGAYHFLTSDPGEDGARQATLFCKFLAAHGGLQPTDMPPVLDLEWDVTGPGKPDRWAAMSPDAIIDKVLVCLRQVQQSLGRTPMLYTARAWWRERIQDESKFQRLAEFPLWIADYSRSARAVEEPAVPNGGPFHLWQFHDSALVAGPQRTGFDANVFYGDEDAFYRTFVIRKFTS